MSSSIKILFFLAVLYQLFATNEANGLSEPIAY